MAQDRPKVLVADDERGPRESIRQILKERYEVVFAEDGDEVVDYLRLNDDVDVVLMDIKMPGKSGLEALREIKEIRKDVEVLVITGYGSLESAVKALKYGAYDYVLKPFEPQAILETVERGVQRGEISRETHERMKRIESLTEDLRKHYVETAEKLIGTINERDGYSCMNTIRLATVAGLLAEELHFLPVDVAAIRHMAVLRDIGKIAVREEILSKESPLDEAERDCLKRHPDITSVLLRAVDFLEEFLAYVQYHHERYDGGGYPEGLSAEEIPTEAGIIAIADAYEAMVNRRPYRKTPLSHEEALMEIRNAAGVQFDPELVEVFLGIADLNERLKKVEDRCRVEGAETILREILLTSPGRKGGT